MSPEAASRRPPPSEDAAALSARRAALAGVCEDAAGRVIGLLVEEAASATNLLGLGRDATRRYGDSIMALLPLVTDAMREADEALRARKIEALSAAVRGVSDRHRIPKIIERGLTAIAVRVGRQAVRHAAPRTGYGADELEAEFILFAEQLEASLHRR